MRARDLDAEAAFALVDALRAADDGIRLVEPAQDVLDAWRKGLADVLDNSRSTALVAGCAAHLLYEAELSRAEQAAELLQRRLSPGTPVADAAGLLRRLLQRRRPAADLRRRLARRRRCAG